MMYELPVKAKINGIALDIRSDFRAVLDIIEAMNDNDLSDREKTAIAIKIFYPNYDKITDYESALKYILWFISAGDEYGSDKPKPQLVDWKKDFAVIVAPINKALGYECRSVKYLHWWTFISAYMEIGECVFFNIVSIRRKLQKRRKLTDWEREFYIDNKDMIDLKSNSLNESEMAIVNNLLNNG